MPRNQNGFCKIKFKSLRKEHITLILFWVQEDNNDEVNEEELHTSGTFNTGQDTGETGSQKGDEDEEEDEVYTGLRTQDLQEAKDQLLVETADMLHIPLFTAEALLRDNG